MSFLELGADSMTLFQVLQSVRKTFGVPIAVSRLFEELNTLRRVAGHIRENASAAALAAVDGPAPAPVAPAAPVPQAVVQVAQPVAPVPVDGTADGGIGMFLDVHARVMAQAYELLGGATAAPAAAPAAPAAPARCAADPRSCRPPNRRGQKRAPERLRPPRQAAPDRPPPSCRRWPTSRLTARTASGPRSPTARPSGRPAAHRTRPERLVAARCATRIVGRQVPRARGCVDIDGNDVHRPDDGLRRQPLRPQRPFIDDAIESSSNGHAPRTRTPSWPARSPG